MFALHRRETWASCEGVRDEFQRGQRVDLRASRRTRLGRSTTFNASGLFSSATEVWRGASSNEGTVSGAHLRVFPGSSPAPKGPRHGDPPLAQAGVSTRTTRRVPHDSARPETLGLEAQRPLFLPVPSPPPLLLDARALLRVIAISRIDGATSSCSQPVRTRERPT